MRNCSGNSYYGTSQPCSGGLITGNSVDINLNQNDSEVRVDIDVARINTIRIWGQVLDCDGTAISNALVKLVKPINMNGTCELQGVAHCVSDYNGFYQFDVPSNGEYNYKILVGKSAYSNERIIAGNDCSQQRPQSHCHPRSHNHCNQNINSCTQPCDQYNQCYEPVRPIQDPCNNCDPCHNYESYNNCEPCNNSYDPCHNNCEPCNQNFDTCLPSYKAQNSSNCDCCDGDNKYATYYYSEPEVFE